MSEDDEDLVEPYEPEVAQRLIRNALREGKLIWRKHVFDKMAELDVSSVEVVNALKAGAPQPAELEMGTWRYPTCTPRLRVLVAFGCPTRVAILTVIRLT